MRHAASLGKTPSLVIAATMAWAFVASCEAPPSQKRHDGGSGGMGGGGSGGGAGGAADGGGTGGQGGGGAGGAGGQGGGTAGTGGAGGTGGLGGTGQDAGSGPDARPADGSVGDGGTTPSPGCGVTGSPASGTYMIDVSGLQREYNIKLPASYDANRPHRLVFAWHGLTGTAAQIQRGGYYGLDARSGGTTIFAAGQGLDEAGGTQYGWPDLNGRDVAFVRALLERIRTQYCIDDKRIFSTGFSYGGMFSNRLGCQMGNVFRAIAPMSGSGPSRSMCVGQVAAWIAHGDMDATVSLASGQGSRDYWVGINHCTTTTMPADPSPCVAYQGCDSGFPVHWCQFAGGHTVASFASAAIWTFFSQF